MHWHSYYEIEYVASGELSEIYNGVQIALSKGMLRLLTPADFHEVIVEQPVTLYKACFDASFLERELSARLYRASLGRAVSLSEEACRLIESLFESALLSQRAACEDAVQRLVKKKLMETIVLIVLSEYEKLGADEKRGRRDVVSTILSYIHENYKRGITLDEIAKKVYLSPGYVSKCFHKRYLQKRQDLVLGGRSLSKIRYIERN